MAWQTDQQFVQAIDHVTHACTTHYPFDGLGASREKSGMHRRADLASVGMPVRCGASNDISNCRIHNGDEGSISSVDIFDVREQRLHVLDYYCTVSEILTFCNLSERTTLILMKTARALG